MSATLLAPHSTSGNSNHTRALTTGRIQRSSSSHGLNHAGLTHSGPPDREPTHRITLQRPEDGTGLGFTVRGGVEHGLGHYVSAVDPGSEAHLQGLRPGDQIVRVDGMSLKGSTHREVVTLISARWRIILEVKTRGVIPIKNRKGDPVTWRSVDKPQPDPLNLDQIKVLKSGERVETRIVINITGQQGLGCSICKGPANKPGIFVQSTKPGGLAREAGMRPGDQILDCNGISFQRLEFTEAVYQLKSSRHLDLLLRKGAGADLFPSESSGYDSSSSSNAGDPQRILHNHPNPQPQKPHQRRPPEGSTRENFGLHNHGPIGKDAEQVAKLSKSASNLTLTNRPTDVTENRLKLEEKLIEEERKRIEEEQERLRREALKLEAEKKRFEEEKKQAALLALQAGPQAPAAGTAAVMRSKSPAHTNTALKSAIQSELQRRANKSKAPPAPPPPPPGGTLPGLSSSLAKVTSGEITVESVVLKKKKKTPLLDNLKNDKHDALMAEFKRAHLKRFKGSSTEEAEEEEGEEEEEEEGEEEEEDHHLDLDRDESMIQETLLQKKEQFVDDSNASGELLDHNLGGEEFSSGPDISISCGSSSQDHPMSSSSSDHDTDCSCTTPASTELESTTGQSEESSTSVSPSMLAKQHSKVLIKPSKTPPPPPPERTSSMSGQSPTHSGSSPNSVTPVSAKLNKHLATFKPSLYTKKKHSVPGIPTPDYDSTPERSPKSHRRTRYHHHGSSGGLLRLSNSMSSLIVAQSPVAPLTSSNAAPKSKDVTLSNSSSNSSTTLVKHHPAFARRHPEIEVGSLDSFSIDPVTTSHDTPKPPPFYFEPKCHKGSCSGSSIKPSPLVSITSYSDKPPTERFEFLPQQNGGSKTVRFTLGEEARIAAKDYRVSNASTTSVGGNGTSSSEEENGRKSSGAGGRRVKSAAPLPPLGAGGKGLKEDKREEKIV